MIWAWLFGGLGGLLAKGGDLLTVVASLKEMRLEKARTKAEIVKAHRELLTSLRALPEFAALYDRERDLHHNPRTVNETNCMRLILTHFSWAFGEHRAGRYDLPSGLREDVRDFFSNPVPRDAWANLKRFHEPRLVAFVDSALSGAN